MTLRIAKCDLDDVEGRLISNPQAAIFEPSTLLCIGATRVVCQK